MKRFFRRKPKDENADLLESFLDAQSPSDFDDLIQENLDTFEAGFMHYVVNQTEQARDAGEMERAQALEFLQSVLQTKYSYITAFEMMIQFADKDMEGRGRLIAENLEYLLGDEFLSHLRRQIKSNLGSPDPEVQEFGQILQGLESELDIYQGERAGGKPLDAIQRRILVEGRIRKMMIDIVLAENPLKREELLFQYYPSFDTTVIAASFQETIRVTQNMAPDKEEASWMISRLKALQDDISTIHEELESGQTLEELKQRRLKRIKRRSEVREDFERLLPQLAEAMRRGPSEGVTEVYDLVAKNIRAIDTAFLEVMDEYIEGYAEIEGPESAGIQALTFLRGVIHSARMNYYMHEGGIGQFVAQFMLPADSLVAKLFQDDMKTLSGDSDVPEIDRFLRTGYGRFGGDFLACVREFVNDMREQTLPFSRGDILHDEQAAETVRRCDQILQSIEDLEREVGL